jgi:hypothetical protein
MPKRYDNVRITNVVDGTTIEGHDAVKAHFDREQELVEQHGSTITFQLYRANLTASTRVEMQGERLAELRIAGGQVSGTDTVAAVKQRILPALLGDRAVASHVTFVFGGRVMGDDALFYADHFMLLPSWVQVVLSDVPFPDVIAAMARLPA